MTDPLFHLPKQLTVIHIDENHGLLAIATYELSIFTTDSTTGHMTYEQINYNTV